MRMRMLGISYGTSCYAKVWKNSAIDYGSLRECLSDPVRTEETVEEYGRLRGDAKQKAKDRGGFVGGILKDGKRNGANVISRSMLALDADRATQSFLKKFPAEFPWAALLYSTHSHTAASPRVRVVIPLTRDISPDEYIAVSRYTAEELGMEMFDPCSFKPQQLMYWPSIPKDGEFVFMERAAEWLDPNDILTMHPGWKDFSTLPLLKSEGSARNACGRRPEDPREKKGVIGAFCRAYSIENAIEEFLPDVYEDAGNGRYSYRAADSCKCPQRIILRAVAAMHHCVYLEASGFIPFRI